MNNLWYDLFLELISAILGASFGVIIPKMMKDKKEMPEAYIDKQIVFSKIQIEQKQYIFHDDTGQQKKNSPTTKTHQGAEILIGYLLIALVTVFVFVKFEKEISLFIICMFVFLETAFLTTAYVTTKKCYIDKGIKSILGFNILAVACVPFLLYLERNPIMGPIVNKQEMLRQAETTGLFSLVSDINVFGFVLYQVLGIVVLAEFMFFTLIGLMHVLSMINLTLTNRSSKLWSGIFAKTFGCCKSVTFYMLFGFCLLVLSFLLVSGVLSMLVLEI